MLPAFIASLYTYNSLNAVEPIIPIDKLAPTTIDCTYRLVFRIDTVAKYPRTEYFRLLVSGTTSVFQSKRQILADSIFSVYDAMPFTQEVANTMTDALSKAPQSEFSYEIYKDISKQSITYVDIIEPKKYSYTEPVSIFNWQINSATRTISGYKCQQANTFFRGRYYTAWFTRQIPIPDGPYKFCGLPGLIVQIQDKTGGYSFELTNLKETTISTPITLPNKVISTTREKFLQGITDFNNSFIRVTIA